MAIAASKVKANFKTNGRGSAPLKTKDARTVVVSPIVSFLAASAVILTCLFLAILLAPDQALGIFGSSFSLVLLPFATNFNAGKDWQLQRRILHLLTGLLCVFNATQPLFLPALLLLCFGSIVIEIARRVSPAARAIFYRFYGNSLRVEEIECKKIPGAFWFLFGAALSVWLFGAEKGRLGLIALAVGDPAAGLSGLWAWKFLRAKKFFLPYRILSTRIFGKSVTGFIGCWVASSVAFAVDGQSTPILLGLVSAFAETFSFIDDNLTIPVVFCALLEVFRLY